jgi:hypothetical protein
MKRLRTDIHTWKPLQRFTNDFSIKGEKTILTLSEHHSKRKQNEKFIKMKLSTEIVDELRDIFQVSSELLRHFWGSIAIGDGDREAKCVKLLAALEQNLTHVRLLQQAVPNQAEDINQVSFHSCRYNSHQPQMMLAIFLSYEAAKSRLH